MTRMRKAPTLPQARGHRGFTLIELIVVLAIVALLASIVAPRYNHSVERAREAALRTSLNVMRDAIDKFAADKGHFPESLGTLVSQGYLRQIPEDPITGSKETWRTVPPMADSVMQGDMADVHSGAEGLAADGEPYAAW